MAIVKMSHFDALIMSDDMELLLDKMQAFTHINFIDQSLDDASVFKPYQQNYDFDSAQHQLDHIKEALKTLKKLAPRRGQLFKDLNSETMRLKELKQALEGHDLDALLSRYSQTYAPRNSAIKDYDMVIPWEKESLSLETLNEYDLDHPFVCTVDTEDVSAFNKELKRLHHPYYMHHSEEHRETYILFVHTDAVDDLKILFDKYDVEKRSVHSLRLEDDIQSMKALFSAYHHKQSDLLSDLEYRDEDRVILEMYYEAIMNEMFVARTRSMFTTSDSLTYLSGWIRTRDEEKLKALFSEFEATYVSIEPASIDSKSVPIILENSKIISAFEPITSMYALPAYNELDPTPILAPFYALFFGMMLADVGYGLIMFVVMSLALRKIRFKPNMEKMVRLLKYLGITTALWGAIYGSFFGGIIAMPALIDISSEFNFVLVLAIVLGLFHLFFGLGVKGYIYYRDNTKRYILYDVIFWYMTLIGLVILISQMFSPMLEPYTVIAKILSVIGMVGIVLTNGREAKTLGGKAASGLYSLYGLSNYIGDVVSYSRLMALGLAGASIGMAFNMMVEMVSGFGVVGIIGGGLIFMVGHTFNLLINGMSTYVHAARLTYVEFFGKFYKGGGRPFVSFRAKPTYIILNEED